MSERKQTRSLMSAMAIRAAPESLRCRWSLREADLVIAFPQRDVHLDTSHPLEVRLMEARGEGRCATIPSAPPTSRRWPGGSGETAVTTRLQSPPHSGIPSGKLLIQWWRREDSNLRHGPAVVGGLLLGYGARIAFGCNIGAYFTGIAFTSLHG